MELNFQKIVLSIAIVIFIILLIFIALALYNNKYSSVYPPTISQCPDYWLDKQNASDSGGMSDNTSNQQCTNVKNLGNSSCDKKMDFSGEFWKGATGTCNKYKWAKSCDLTWDGITNNSDICSK